MIFAVLDQFATFESKLRLRYNDEQYLDDLIFGPYSELDKFISL